MLEDNFYRTRSSHNSRKPNSSSANIHQHNQELQRARNRVAANRSTSSSTAAEGRQGQHNQELQRARNRVAANKSTNSSTAPGLRSRSQPSTTPKIYSADAAERWSNPKTAITPPPKAKKLLLKKYTSNSNSNLAKLRRLEAQEVQRFRNRVAASRSNNSSTAANWRSRQHNQELQRARNKVAASRSNNFSTAADWRSRSQPSTAPKIYSADAAERWSNPKIAITPRPKPQKAPETDRRSWWDKVKDNASDIGHTALDVAGFIPVVGGVADLANAGWYAAEGDWTNAALSATAAIPGVGDAVAVVKIGAKATSAVAGAAAVSRVSRIGQAGITDVQRATSRNSFLRDELGRFAPNPNSSLTQSKHKSAEYRKARNRLKRDSINNPNLPRHIRGWLEQEKWHRGNNPSNWRNPPGYDTGHINPNDNTQLRWETSHQNRSRGARFGS